MPPRNKKQRKNNDSSATGSSSATHSSAVVAAAAAAAGAAAALAAAADQHHHQTAAAINNNNDINDNNDDDNNNDNGNEYFNDDSQQIRETHDCLTTTQPQRQQQQQQRQPLLLSDAINGGANSRSSSSNCSSSSSSSSTILEPYDKPPRNVPQPPSNADEGATWSFDEKTRVLLADFRHVEKITLADKKHLLQMMERDDISVVSWGLLLVSSFLTDEQQRQPTTKLMNSHPSILDFLASDMGDDMPYHDFRRFDRVLTKTTKTTTTTTPTTTTTTTTTTTATTNGESYYVYKDTGIMYTMTFGDFQKYLLLKINSPWEAYEFMDQSTKERIRFEKTDDVVLLMTDIEMETYVRQLDSIYKELFKMREILPGKEFCMTKPVSRTARPWKGPKLYLGTGGFTAFGQAGHGTVDIGHTCMSGFTEAVLLRRLPEEHKRHASKYLHADGQLDPNHSGYESNKSDREIWPNNNTVEEWTRMNYCPSIFILRPGQHLHLNKGRLHCFRTLTPEQLGPNDCHASLRRNLLQELKSTDGSGNPFQFLSLSIEYEWMYLGFTDKGIEKEVRSCLECADLCRAHEPVPLKYPAIPETALLQIAKRMARVKKAPTPSQRSETILPDPLNLCKGILPSLTAVVQQELANSEIPTKRASRPDAQESPDTNPIDPFGSDYSCKLCCAELSNTYYHCCGCENLMAKDMNICLRCFEGKRFYRNVSMHSFDDRWVSDVNHTGTNDKEKRGRGCSCRVGICRDCSFCLSCSCRCHHHFQQNQRFFTFSQLERNLHSIRVFVEKKGLFYSGDGYFVEDLQHCTD